MHFETVLVICLIGSLAFLLGSLLVVARLPRTQNAAGVLVIEWHGLTVKTNDVCTAVAVLATALAVTIPIFTAWLNSRIDDSPVTLRVTLAPSQVGAKVKFTYDGDSELESGSYTFPVFKSSLPQGFAMTNTSSPTKDYHSIAASYSWIDRYVHVTVDNVEVASTPANGGYVDVPLRFVRAQLPPAAVIRRMPRTQPPIAAAGAALRDPILPGGHP